MPDGFFKSSFFVCFLFCAACPPDDELAAAERLAAAKPAMTIGAAGISYEPDEYSLRAAFGPV